MNYYANPDYPASPVNFMQFTNQPAVNNSSFYYGGAGYVADSAPRRANNPFNQAPQYGYPQPTYYPQPPLAQNNQPQNGQYMSGSVADMLSMPEKNIQPFSSYGSNTGNSVANLNGFNSYITEARRADAYNASQAGNNPWAQNPQPVVQPAAQPAAPVVNPFVQPHPYSYNYSMGNEIPGMYSVPSYQAYDNKVGVNQWDNMYGQVQTNYNINPMMSRAWPEANTPQQRPINYNFPQPVNQMNYPPAVPIKFDAEEFSWAAEANTNWGMK